MRSCKANHNRKGTVSTTKIETGIKNSCTNTHHFCTAIRRSLFRQSSANSGGYLKLCQISLKLGIPISAGAIRKSYWSRFIQSRWFYNSSVRASPNMMKHWEDTIHPWTSCYSLCRLWHLRERQNRPSKMLINSRWKKNLWEYKRNIRIWSQLQLNTRSKKSCQFRGLQVVGHSTVQTVNDYRSQVFKRKISRKKSVPLHFKEIIPLFKKR